MRSNLEFAVGQCNFIELTLRKFGSIPRNSSLLFKLKQMPPVRRQRIDKVYRHRTVDGVAFAGQILGETTRYGRRDAHQFGIHECNRRNAISDVREERPAAEQQKSTSQ